MKRPATSGTSHAAAADAEPTAKSGHDGRTPLLDVNVLIALAWPNHVHHAAAIAWFEAVPDRAFATAPITQAGFIRVSSNTRVVPQATTPQLAHAQLTAIAALPGHRFWPDGAALVASPHIAWERIGSAGRVTDAHLLAIALAHKGRLATFDRAITHLVPTGARRDAVLVIA